jgi:MFS transporter, PAT family, beta-lactamase induction signal transducer AmpG
MSVLRITAMSMAESKIIRLFVCFVLYFGQGVLVGFFFFVMPSWQAVHGVSMADIGTVLTAASSPWVLKAVSGIIMDRFVYLKMGRRRPCIIGSQIFILCCLVLLGIINPVADDVAIIASFAFAVNLATSFLDVATDGLAVDILKDNERASANGYMFGGQAIGIAISTSVTGYLAIRYGINATTIAIAAPIVLAAGLIVCVRENKGESVVPWTKGAALPMNIEVQMRSSFQILESTFRGLMRRNVLLMLGAAFSMGICGGIFRGSSPVFAAEILGRTGDEYTRLSSFAMLISGLMGASIFGLITSRIGTKNTMIASFLIVAAICGLAMLMRQKLSLPNNFRLFYTMITAFKVLGSIAWAAMAMRMCTRGIAATQFALFTAAVAVGVAVGPLIMGLVDRFGGYSAILLSMVVFNLIGAALTLFAHIIRDPLLNTAGSQL